MNTELVSSCMWVMKNGQIINFEQSTPLMEGKK